MAGPVPPDLHWALVLLIAIVTCGLFNLIWIFVESSFVKEIDRGSNATVLFVFYILTYIAGNVLFAIGQEGSEDALIGLGAFALIVCIVLWLVAVFGMKGSLERYYNSVEPYGLRLRGVMTFFFSILYFQHHFSKIARWKKTGARW